MTPRSYHPPAIGGYCAHLAPCSTQEAPVPCTLTATEHTIHCCANRDCQPCHSGKAHAEAMVARRRAAAEWAHAEAMVARRRAAAEWAIRKMRAEMGGLDE